MNLSKAPQMQHIQDETHFLSKDHLHLLSPTPELKQKTWNHLDQ